LIRVFRLLLGLLGGFWVVAGTLAVGGVLDFGLSSGARVLGLLMFANGAALLFAAWSCLRGSRAVDYATALLLAANAVLSVTDEIGLLDAASLVVSVALLVLLLVGRVRRGTRSDADV
jgi:hypothetical protein